MSPAFCIWTHFAFALLVGNVLALLLRRQSKRLSILLCLIISTAIGLLPFQQTDISGFALVHMGTLSISTLLLMTAQLLTIGQFIKPLSPQILTNINLFWITAGMLLYPSALGLFSFDTYAYGYKSTMSWCILMLSGLTVLCGQRILGLCLASAVLAHLMQLHESPNLWDYLIDPWLCIAALIAYVVSIFRQLIHQRDHKAPEVRVQDT
ncbi:MAG: hypothetical protein U0936_07660 [Planctomycetaceae bacterium]